MFQKSWLQYLIILAIVMIFVLWFKRQDLSKYYEGFDQDTPYFFKHGDQIYDDFYIEIYDKLMMPEERCPFEMKKIVEMTHPSVEHSSILDIGTGTGELATVLSKAGYHTFALDKSKSMIKRVNKKCSNVQTKCGNAQDSVIYDKGSFSHIIATGFMVYMVDCPDTFLRNCYYWLKSGGYLVLHVVDRDNFDTIVPAGVPRLLKNPQDYAKERIVKTGIDFIDFKYDSKYDFSKVNDDVVVFTETFTDELSKNVRQQETTLNMKTKNAIVNLAKRAGFIVKGEVAYEHDKHQYLMILERPQ